MKETKGNRDASIDRQLAAALNVRASDAGDDACLDADTVAAWADQALDGPDRARVEAHAADCARCQALLAAMVRTSPPAAAMSRWRIPALGWLVPVAAAATALAVWVAVPSREPVQVSDGGAQAVDQAAPPPEQALKTEPRPVTRSRQAPRDEPQAKAAASGDAAVSAPAAPEADEAGALKKRVEPQPAQAATNEPALEPSGQAPASPRDVKSLNETVTLQTPAPTVAPQRATAGPAAAVDTLASGRAAFADATETVIVSSNPATRFRLLRGGAVQRSADAGATWRTEVTGAAESLTAGASPSPSVCWLVGRSGTVLLSTDGRSWRRLAFPAAVDLRAVAAADRDNATVTTADGRAFVTADGGRTWARAPE